MVAPRICVVGSCMIDLISTVPRLPVVGETLVGRSFHLGYGGKGANQAVAAARLGAAVSMVARVGRDAFGEGTIRNFEAYGVDASHVGYDDRRFSGAASILVDEHADNAIVIVPGANDGLSADDVRAARDVILGSDVLCCQLEVPVETTLEALRIARSGAVRTILNPAPAAPLPDELLRLADFCVPNEVEARMLTGQPVEDLAGARAAARVLLDRGPSTVIVTLGARGALLVERDSAEHVPPVEVAAVDPTGAGDAFIGALAVFVAEGRPAFQAAVAAAAVAALSVVHVGTQVSFPTRRDVEAFLGPRDAP